ncbi:hypothetical protein Srot_0161 [Segniliparus rotundus DSM 44985]|uniref:ESX-1 secretion-associated protein n=1 Tax=Segniliparus rotundus (strain ATCC BAA-972 / CDC 1076 / CIP 108378 / DSM 44985 / JCM 13578) TaxID=640132 RepID=D6ZAA8_SEGRD|nr:hypothetical protein [Segniliparus rotundus]ADG96650.1 hypothetical protein Srot_0161 [Segniliparus rotundus DSM 44985]
MPANTPTGAGPHVRAELDELRSGVDQLRNLAEETKDKLASSDSALAGAKSAWPGMRAAGVFAAYADAETARGAAMAESFTTAGDNVAHAAEQYEHVDGVNADALRLR